MQVLTVDFFAKKKWLRLVKCYIFEHWTPNIFLNLNITRGKKSSILEYKEISLQVDEFFGKNNSKPFRRSRQKSRPDHFKTMSVNVAPAKPQKYNDKDRTINDRYHILDLCIIVVCISSSKDQKSIMMKTLFPSVSSTDKDKNIISKATAVYFTKHAIFKRIKIGTIFFSFALEPWSWILLLSEWPESSTQRLLLNSHLGGFPQPSTCSRSSGAFGSGLKYTIG